MNHDVAITNNNADQTRVIYTLDDIISGKAKEAPTMNDKEKLDICIRALKICASYLSPVAISALKVIKQVNDD